MPFDATPKVNRPAVQQNAQTLGLLGNGATANGVLVQFPGASAGYTIPTATTRGEGTQVPLTRANVTLSTGTAWPAFVTSDLPPPANALDPLADARVVGRTFEFWQMQQVDAHPPAEEGPPPDLIAPWYVYSPATGALLINHFRGELEVYLKASGVETNRSGIVVLYALQTSVDGNNWQLAGLLARKLMSLQNNPNGIHYAITVPHVRGTYYRVVVAREQDGAPATMDMIATDPRISYELNITEPY